MECPNCGFQNVPGLTVCARCQSALELTDVDVRPPRRGERPVRSWLARRWAGLRAYRAVLPAMPREATRVLAVIPMALVPGLGQIRLGRRRIGRALLMAWLAGIAASLLMAGTEYAWLWYVLVLGIHCMSFGLLLGDVLQHHRLAWRLVAGLLVFLGLHYLLYMPARFGLSRMVTTVRLHSPATSPVVRDGDVLVCQGRWLRPREFRRGELVLYSLQPGVHYDQTQAVDRVLGVPGDRLRIRKGELLINDQPLPPGRGPLGSAPNWPDLEVTAGEDEYLILPSLMPLYAPRDEAGRIGGYVQQVLDGAIRVRSGRIEGRALYRLHPLWRAGRVE